MAKIDKNCNSVKFRRMTNLATQVNSWTFEL